ncbi:MAG: hypothetical protein AB1489_28455 [Acidobacteriota bacterium]
MAQQPQSPNDPIGKQFFSPELVLQNQSSLNLTDEQKNFFKSEIRTTQKQFIDLQFQLQDELSIMSSLVKQQPVDEQQVLAQLDKVLAIEREIKRAQLGILIKIKNILTPAQQTRLQEIQSKQK